MPSSFLINELSVSLVSKNIRNLNLRITPPLGNVVVSAPHGFPEEKIHEFVRSKIHWIRKHQERIRKTGYVAPLKYVTGEEHYFLGKSFRLHVIEKSGKPAVILQPCHFDPVGVHRGRNLSVVTDSSSQHHSTSLRVTTGFGMTMTLESDSRIPESGDCLRMFVRPGTRKKKRQEVLESWYREKLKEIVPEYITLYEPKMNVTVSAWGIKKMKTKWGTCNITKKRIWLNLELTKKPIEAIEQVVVHELVHLLERKHTKRFYALVKEYLGREEEKL